MVGIDTNFQMIIQISNSIVVTLVVGQGNLFRSFIFSFAFIAKINEIIIFKEKPRKKKESAAIDQSLE